MQSSRRSVTAGGGRRIEALDGIRGFAAVVVVIDHCLMVFPRFSDRIAPSLRSDPVAFLLQSTPLGLVWDGTAAVMVFFVLSGFVLSLPWLDGRPLSYPIFVIRRVFRIYVPYIVAVALGVGLASGLSGFRPPALSTWFYTTNWAEPFSVQVALDQLFMLGRHISFDNATWSLNYEMRISLVFPILLLPLLRLRFYGAVLSIVAAVLLAKLAQSLAGASPLLKATGMTLHYAALFILGAAAAQLSGRMRRRLEALPGWVTLGLCLLGLLILALPSPYQPDFCMGCGAAMIILIASTHGPVARFLERPAVQVTGRISYSLYLVHLLVLLSVVHLTYGVVPLSLAVACVLPLSLLLAWLFNRAVEQPAIRLGRSLSNGRFTPVPQKTVVS